MRRSIVVLAVAALLCGCRQEDATTPEEPKALKAAHYEAPTVTPVPAEPVAVDPVPSDPPENVPVPETVPPEAPSH
jgi:hypothetical protein